MFLPKKKTNEEFINRVKKSVGDEYAFLDKYVNAKTKIRVRHNKCGGIYKVRPDSFLDGARCPYCAGNKSITNEEFINRVKELAGDEYTFLDKYINANIKIRVRHNKCGRNYFVAPSTFLRGHRCPYCYFDSVKMTNNRFSNKLSKTIKREYAILEPFLGYDTLIKVKHKICGNIYQARPRSILQDAHCPYCYGVGGAKKEKR